MDLSAVPTIAIDRVLSGIKGVTPGRILQLRRAERRVLNRYVVDCLRQQGYSYPAIAEVLGYASHASAIELSRKEPVSKETVALVMRPLVVVPQQGNQ